MARAAHGDVHLVRVLERPRSRSRPRWRSRDPPTDLDTDGRVPFEAKFSGLGETVERELDDGDAVAEVAADLDADR